MAKSRQAKFSPPRAAQAVVRDRLHAELDTLARGAVVWIAAGPGSGKSTLAATWAGARERRVLWYRVDETDADAGSAFARLEDLVRTIRPRQRLPAYGSRQQPSLDGFARGFFRTFYETLPAGATIVFDDAHAGGPAFDTLLAAAVRETPPDVTLLIVSRTVPSGPVLDDVARGHVRCLDAAALAFTADEAAALFAAQRRRVDARAIRSRADGWVAGMLLLADAGDEGRVPLSRAAPSLREFFATRFIAPLAESERRVLAAASLLPDVDAATLERMGLGPEATELLERLRGQHAFVVRLDREPASWRLHDLLRDELRARFEASGDAGWRTRVRAAAAREAAARGLVRDAVALHLAAGDDDSALALAESTARRLVAEHRATELEAVVALVGGERAARSLTLQLACGEAAVARNDVPRAVEALERAYALLPTNAPTPDGLLIASTALGAILEGWQDFAGTPTWAQRVALHLPARDRVSDPDDGLRIDASCLLGSDMLWQDATFGEVAALSQRMLARLRAPVAGASADAMIAAGTALMESAGYSQSDEALFRATAAASVPWLATGRASPLTEAAWLTAYGPLARRWPVPEIRLRSGSPLGCIERAFELARDYGGRGTAFGAAFYCANIALSENDRAALERWIGAMREVTDAAQPTRIVNLLTVEAGAAALAADWRTARATAERALAVARGAGFPPSQCWSIEMFRERVEIATGHADRAAETLRELAQRSSGGIYQAFPVILADVADYARTRAGGGVDAALVRRIMDAAAQWAWPGFATMIAPIAAQLCADALRLGIQSDFAHLVIRERKLTAPTPFEADWPWPMRVYALGTLRIEVDGRDLAFGARAPRKPLELLKAIVAHGPEAVDSAVVLDALWPAAEGGAARAAFDMTVMRLRKMLGREDAIRLDAGRVGLDVRNVWVDAWAFAGGATDVYPGPLFGVDTVEPWWAAARERLHQRFLRRALERGAALERARDVDAALDVYEAGLAQDPLAEAFYQGAIRCHLAAGRRADALRVLRRCREQLSIVLGVAPSAATLALVEGRGSA